MRRFLCDRNDDLPCLSMVAFTALPGIDPNGPLAAPFGFKVLDFLLWYVDVLDDEQDDECFVEVVDCFIWHGKC